MDTMMTLRGRRSVREYAPRPVPRSVREEIVDAGRLAARARDVQPWHFVVVTERAAQDKQAEVCENGKFLAQAAACIVVFCDAGAKYYLADGSAATQNVLMAPPKKGLGQVLHWERFGG